MYNKYPYTDFHELNLDWFLSEFKKLKEDWETTSGQWDQMQLNFETLESTVQTFTTFVENYFENLDVQDEINNKLDALVADGTLSTLLAPLVDDKLPGVVDDKLGAVVTDQLPGVVTDQLPGVVSDQIGDAVAPEVPAAVTDWLEDNVDPVGSAVTIDSSLSISGSAADAKVVGNKFDFIDVDFEDSVIDAGIIHDNEYVNPANGAISTGVTTYRTATLQAYKLNFLFLAYDNRNILTYESAAFYKADGTFISGEQPLLNSQSEQVEHDGVYGTYFTIPAGTGIIILNLQKTRDNQRHTAVNYTEKVINMKNYIYSDPLKGKNIINFGDSIFGNYRDTNDGPDKSISKIIQDYTGATVYNAGFGGCRMATAYQYWDKFSMHSLADAIANGDWSAQEQALIDGSGDLPAYFTDTVDMLKSIDFSTIDYITIGYGTNDYTGNVSLASYGDALKYSLNKILTAYPKIRIAVISPCWRWWASGGTYAYSSDDAQSENTHGDKLTDYVDVCETVCKEYHVAYIDTYYTLGFNQFTYSYYFNGTDGTHPNQYGRKLRADRIIGQMQALF